MTKEELARLKGRLVKAVEEATGSNAPLDSIEKLRAVADAAKAYAELDALETGDTLRAAMVSRLRDMNDGILLWVPGSDAWAGAKNDYLSCMSFASKVLGVTFNELECEVCGCGED